MFLELNMVRAGEDQCNSAYWNSGSKTVVHSEGCWRYDNLQWRFAASGKLKFSSAISFPVNIKAMSVDIWEQRLCSWMSFSPLSWCFVASISLPALRGRGSEERGTAAPQPPSARCFSVLTPDVSLWCLQIYIQASLRTEYCSSGRFMEASKWVPFHIVLHGAKPLCLHQQNCITDLTVLLFVFLSWALFSLMHCKTDFIV